MKKPEINSKCEDCIYRKEREALSNELEQTTAKLKETEEKLKTLVQKKEMEENIERLSEQVQDLQIFCDQKDEKIKELQDLLQNLNELSSSTELKHLIQVNYLNPCIEEKDMCIEKANEEVEKFKTIAESKANVLKTVENSLREISTRYSELLKELSYLKVEELKLEETAHHFTQESNSTIKKLENTIGELKNENDNLRLSLCSSDSENHNLLDKLEETKKSVNSLMENNRRKDEVIDNLSQRIQNLEEAQTQFRMDHNADVKRIQEENKTMVSHHSLKVQNLECSIAEEERDLEKALEEIQKLESKSKVLPESNIKIEGLQATSEILRESSDPKSSADLKNSEINRPKTTEKSLLDIAKENDMCIEKTDEEVKKLKKIAESKGDELRTVENSLKEVNNLYSELLEEDSHLMAEKLKLEETAHHLNQEGSNTISPQATLECLGKENSDLNLSADSEIIKRLQSSLDMSEQQRKSEVESKSSVEMPALQAEILRSKDRIAHPESDTKDNVPICETVKVPYDLHRFIIGQGGKDVRNLIETYDVNITIPSAASKSDIVAIKGPPANVEKAKAALLNRIERLEEKQDRVKLEKDFKAVNQFREKLTGLDEWLTAVQKRLSKLEQTSCLLEVVTKQMEDLKVLEGEFELYNEVDRKLPYEFPQIKQLCRVEDVKPIGKMVFSVNYKSCLISNKIREVKLSLEKSYKEAKVDNVPICETVEVSYDLHRFIIGQGGKDVRNLIETYDVNITIPSVASKSDIVTIKGPPANVEKAKAALLERIERLEEEKQDRESAGTRGKGKKGKSKKGKGKKGTGSAPAPTAPNSSTNMPVKPVVTAPVKLGNDVNTVQEFKEKLTSLDEWLKAAEERLSECKQRSCLLEVVTKQMEEQKVLRDEIEQQMAENCNLSRKLSQLKVLFDAEDFKSTTQMAICLNTRCQIIWNKSYEVLVALLKGFEEVEMVETPLADLHLWLAEKFRNKLYPVSVYSKPKKMGKIYDKYFSFEEEFNTKCFQLDEVKKKIAEWKDRYDVGEIKIVEEKQEEIEKQLRKISSVYVERKHCHEELLRLRDKIRLLTGFLNSAKERLSEGDTSGSMLERNATLVEKELNEKSSELESVFLTKPESVSAKDSELMKSDLDSLQTLWTEVEDIVDKMKSRGRHSIVPDFDVSPEHRALLTGIGWSPPSGNSPPNVITEQEKEEFRLKYGAKKKIL